MHLHRERHGKSFLHVLLRRRNRSRILERKSICYPSPNRYLICALFLNFFLRPYSICYISSSLPYPDSCHRSDITHTVATQSVLFLSVWSDNICAYIQTAFLNSPGICVYRSGSYFCHTLYISPVRHAPNTAFYFFQNISPWFYHHLLNEAAPAQCCPLPGIQDTFFHFETPCSCHRPNTGCVLYKKFCSAWHIHFFLNCIQDSTLFRLHLPFHT